MSDIHSMRDLEQAQAEIAELRDRFAAKVSAEDPAPRHWSSCAIYNAPAYPAGPCDCGGNAPAAEAPAPDVKEMTPAFLLALGDYEQADMHGTMVKVSRQAVDETLEHVTRLTARVRELEGAVAYLQTIVNDDGAEEARLSAEVERLRREFTKPFQRIALLEAENERLRAALKHYACECWGNVKCYHECSPCGSWARDALEYKGAPTPGNACMGRAALKEPRT